MGTRGSYGFYYKGRYYMVYNHYDSGPLDLGIALIEEIKEAIKDGSFGLWLPRLLSLKIVGEEEDEKEELVKVNKIEESKHFSYPRLVITILNVDCFENYVCDDGTPSFEMYTYIVNFDTEQFDFYIDDEKYSSFPLSCLPNQI